MVSPSKKKKKITIVAMNQSIRKRSSALSLTRSSNSPNNIKRHRRSSLSPSLKAKTAAISHPSSTKIYPPLTNTSFFSSIRLYSKDASDMVSEISKNILNDFELLYEKKSNIKNGDRRSSRLMDSRDNTIVQDTAVNPSTSLHRIKDLSSYRRCLLEDFMILSKNTHVVVLIPFKIECPLLVQDSFWTSIDSNSFMNYQSIIAFKKKKYHCISGIVTTNPKIDVVRSGISHYDLMDGLGSKNLGCLIDFGDDDDGDQIFKLVTWNMVLKGGVTGIQVWSQRKEFRNLATVFNNRKKTHQGLVSLLNAMYYEMYGDRLQCINLLSLFYRTQLKQKQLELKNKSTSNDTIEKKEDVIFEGSEYYNLITDVDLTFKNAIKSTYTSFCVLGGPLVSAQQINELVDRFK